MSPPDNGKDGTNGFVMVMVDNGGMDAKNNPNESGTPPNDVAVRDNVATPFTYRFKLAVLPPVS
jgi:hypothetical protein